MHHSLCMPPVKGHRFCPSTALLLSEIVKLAVSLTMALYDLSVKQQNTSVAALFTNLLHAVVSAEMGKMAFPAVLYTLQNTLQYIAAANVDILTFQITYQLKILTTAVFSAVLLARPLSTRKWLSLLLLTCGIAMADFSHFTMPVTMSDLRGDSRSSYLAQRSLQNVRGSESPAPLRLVRRSATYQGIAEDTALHNPTQHVGVGLAVIIISCITSGLAGAYFERVLKYKGSKQMNDPGHSVWVRNVQLTLFSVPLALFAVMYRDGENIAHDGFFAGYNWAVWTVVGLQATGGIVVALVIDLAKNTTKNNALSTSVLISLLASLFFSELEMTSPVSKCYQIASGEADSSVRHWSRRRYSCDLALQPHRRATCASLGDRRA